MRHDEAFKLLLHDNPGDLVTAFASELIGQFGNLRLKQPQDGRSLIFQPTTGSP